MSIKNAVTPYYHYLYRTLKLADSKLHEQCEEEMTNVMIEDIVRLDALMSLLVYVDNTIPVIRCQKAFSKLKAELENLYFLYREQKVIGTRHHATLGWEIGKAIDIDIAIMGEQFKAQSNDLYLNTVHATEQAIADHINLTTEEEFQIGLLAYFTDCLEEIEEFKFDKHKEEIGYLTRSLLANLHFIAYIGNNKNLLAEKHFFTNITNAVSLLKTMHVYQNSIKSMGTNNKIVGDLATQLRKELELNMSELKTAYEGIINSKDEILEYVTSSSIEEATISEKIIRESIHARNLLHSFT